MTQQNNALLYACNQPYNITNYETIKYLLLNNAFVDTSDIYGFTPLMCAVCNSNVSPFIVKLLLDNNANVNAQCNCNQTALIIACRFSQYFSSLDTVQLLINYGANINIVDNDNKSALFYACLWGNSDSTLETVQLLLNNNANVNLQNNIGMSPLMVACDFSSTSSSLLIVQLLLNHNANINQQNNDGWTALLFSCKNSHNTSSFFTVQLLLNNKADINLQDNYGWSCLMTVSIYLNISSHIDTLNLLLNYGASIITKNIYKKNVCDILLSNQNHHALSIITHYSFLSNNIYNLTLQYPSYNVSKFLYILKILLLISNTPQYKPLKSVFIYVLLPLLFM